MSEKPDPTPSNPSNNEEIAILRNEINRLKFIILMIIIYVVVISLYTQYSVAHDVNTFLTNYQPPPLFSTPTMNGNFLNYTTITLQ